MASYIKRVGNADIGAAVTGNAHAVLGKSAWSASANAIGALGIDLFGRSVNLSADTHDANPQLRELARQLAQSRTVWPRRSRADVLAYATGTPGSSGVASGSRSAVSFCARCSRLIGWPSTTSAPARAACST